MRFIATTLTVESTPVGRVFTALLVVAILAILCGSALATPVAANADLTVAEPTVDAGESIVGETAEHTIGVNASDIDVSDGPASITIELSGWKDGEVHPPETADIEVLSNGTVVAGPETDGETITFDIDDTSAETLDFEAEITVELTHPTTTTAEGETDTVVAGVSDSDGNSETSAAEFVLHPETLEADFGPDEVSNFGDRTEARLLLNSNRSSGDSERDLLVSANGFDGDDLAGVFADNVTVENSEESDSTVRLRNRSIVDSVPLSFDGVQQATYTFEVTAADTGATSVTNPIAVTEPDTDAEFGSDVFETQAGEFAAIDIALEETNDAYVLVSADRPSERSGLTNHFDILYVQGDSEFLLNTRLIGTDAPSSDVYVSDGSVVSYRHNPDDPAFDDLTFEDETGETVAESVTEFRDEIGDTDLPRPLQPERYRLVAGADDSIVLRDDGIPDFERPLARSNLLLTEPGLENVTLHTAPRSAANDLDESDSPETVDSADDIASLELSETFHERLTQRDTVAEGDRLVAEIETTGIYGLVWWLERTVGYSGGHGAGPEVLEDLLDSPEGIVFDIEHTNPGRNEVATQLELADATDGDVYLIPENADADDPTVIDRYYLVIDTRRAAPFDRQPVDGDEFELEFGYTAAGNPAIFGDDPGNHFPYFEEGASNDTHNRTFCIEEPTIEYNRTDVSDRPIVTNGTNGTISGETNVAPGTDGTIQLIAENRTPPTRITIEDVEIEADGSFNVSHDLSPLRAGTGVEVEFYRQGEILDKRPAVVITDDEPLPAFEITELTNETTVPRGASLRDIRTTVLNNGTVGDIQSVRFDIDGETVDQRTLDLDARGAATYSYSGVQIDRPPGTYNYTLVTNDDEATGQLTIEGDEPSSSDENADQETDEEGETTDETTPSEPDDGTDEEGDGTGESDDSDSTDTTDPNDSTDEEDEGQQEGLAGLLSAIPVGSRHAIGGAAVVGAAHILGYWA